MDKIKVIIIKKRYTQRKKQKALKDSKRLRNIWFHFGKCPKIRKNQNFRMFRWRGLQKLYFPFLVIDNFRRTNFREEKFWRVDWTGAFPFNKRMKIGSKLTTYLGV